MQPISLHWFAVQQQISTLKRQKFGWFYVKFSAEFNELSLFFQKQQEVAKETEVVWKNANRRHSEAKG